MTSPHPASAVVILIIITQSHLSKFIFTPLSLYLCPENINSIDLRHESLRTALTFLFISPASWLLSFSVVQQKKASRELKVSMVHKKWSESMDYQMGTLGLPSALEQVRMRCEVLWWRWHERATDGGGQKSMKVGKTRKLSFTLTLSNARWEY